MTITSDSHCQMVCELIAGLEYLLNQKKLEDEISGDNKNLSDIQHIEGQIQELQNRVDEWRSRK